MAIFRKVHTSIWSDAWFSEISQDKKLFYIYLLTNERTKQCGVYEITKKQIAFDLGYTIDRVSKLLDHFINIGKIRYNNDTKEVALGNWLKFNSSTSPKVQKCINQEFSLVKDTLLIEYVKSMDTEPQEEEEKEEEKEEDVRAIYDEFLKQTDNPNYHSYVSYLFGDNEKMKPLTKVLSRDEQISPEYFNILMKEKKPGKSLMTTTFELNNYNKQYKTFYSTLLNWVRR